MKKNIVILSIISLLSISYNAFSQNENSNIQDVLNDFKNISGSFNQVQNNNNKAKTMNGTFSFAQPNKFIWEYKKPMHQIIQSDGNKIYLYDKDLQQISIKSTNEAMKSSPIAIFFNNKEWINKFNYSSVNKNTWTKNLPINNVHTWIVLKPKEKDSIYKNLSIGLEKNKSLTPKFLTFQDNLGNDGYIEFNNINKKNFNERDFKFNIPKGIDVIE